jgi:hypothetical protein
LGAGAAATPEALIIERPFEIDTFLSGLFTLSFKAIGR